MEIVKSRFSCVSLKKLSKMDNLNCFFFYVWNKKISFFINPERVFKHFDGSLDKTKARNLSSVCIARCVRYIGFKTKNHNRKKYCDCFKCKLDSQTAVCFRYQRTYTLNVFHKNKKIKIAHFTIVSVFQIVN